jgi:hypothetical protein
MNAQTWQPLADDKLKKIRKIFTETYPESEYGDLAGRIGSYWTAKLREVWENKDGRINLNFIAFY